MYLFGVKLIQLRLLTIPPPETKHFCFGTVSHVDELFIPPALIYSANVAPQHNTIIAYLETKAFLCKESSYNSIQGSHFVNI